MSEPDHPGLPRPRGDHIMAAVYRHENQAIRVVEHLIQNDFLMDRISLLGCRFSKGDDFLGIYHPAPLERMKKWAKWGILGGALWGFIASLISMFASLESTNQAHLFETFLWTMTYSAVVGGIMAAAAAFTQVANMLNRMGVPKEHLDKLEQAIKDHKFVILLQGSREELEPFRYKIEHSGAEFFLDCTAFRMEV